MGYGQYLPIPISCMYVYIYISVCVCSVSPAVVQTVTDGSRCFFPWPKAKPSRRLPFHQIRAGRLQIRHGSLPLGHGTIWNQDCATRLALACGSWLKLQIRVTAICVYKWENTGFGPKLRYSVESKCCNLIPSGMMTLPWKIALWQISTYSIWWFSLPGWRYSDECCGSPTCSPQVLHFSSEGKLPGSSP